MHSVYHFYLVNQPNFVFITFKISCSCALYSLHLECNLYPHLVIKIIIYILFRRYILISMIPILTNTNNTISMVFQIISAKKTILAKLLHLLTGFIGEIRDQISIYICVRYINRTFAIRFRYLLMNTVASLPAFILLALSISHHFLTTNLRHLRQI